MDKILLILDLDETLVHATIEKLNHSIGIKVFEYYIYERPHLRKFLDYAQGNFELAIWSSAGDEYVKEVVKRTILKDYQFTFIWGRSRAVYRRNYEMNSSNFRDHYQYIKPLLKVKRLGYDIQRMLIIDDSPHKSINNYGNAIYPIPYEGDRNDNELLKLILYLDLIKDQKNLRSLEKRGWQSKVNF